MDKRTTIVERFGSLESCQARMQRVGGYCGKGCIDYGNGYVANCKPLVQVVKQ
jgi:hypothetical protein